MLSGNKQGVGYAILGLLLLILSSRMSYLNGFRAAQRLPVDSTSIPLECPSIPDLARIQACDKVFGIVQDFSLRSSIATEVARDDPSWGRSRD